MNDNAKPPFDITPEQKEAFEKNVNLCIQFHRHMESVGLSPQNMEFVGGYMAAINALNQGKSPEQALNSYRQLLAAVVADAEAKGVMIVEKPH